MTRRILNCAIAAAAICLVAPSCSVFKKSSSTVSGETGTEVATYPSSTTTSTTSKKQSSSSTRTSTSSSTHATSSLEGKLDGEWLIVAAGKTQIYQDEDMPYIYFEEATGRFYASNGCNILNGAYATVEQNEIAMSSVLSTLKSCPDVAYAQAISNALQDGTVATVKIEYKDNSTFAYLTSSTGKKLLTLRRHNTEELNGEWTVTQIGNDKMSDIQPNIFLDIPEKKVHGNTGCNYFNGELYITPNVSDSLSFSEMGVTKMSCPNSDIERSMLVALEQASYYTLSGNTLRLLDSSRKVLMTLSRD